MSIVVCNAAHNPGCICGRLFMEQTQKLESMTKERDAAVEVMKQQKAAGAELESLARQSGMGYYDLITEAFPEIGVCSGPRHAVKSLIQKHKDIVLQNGSLIELLEQFASSLHLQRHHPSDSIEACLEIPCVKAARYLRQRHEKGTEKRDCPFGCGCHKRGDQRECISCGEGH